MRRRQSLSALLCLLGAALAGAIVSGCPKTDQSLVLVAGESVSATQIDERPLTVLPSGALVVSKLDAEAMFRSGFGQQAGQLIHNLVPLGTESGFNAGRDVKRIYSAFYAMQGADFCGVVQGTFDVEAIRRAADARAQTPSGVALVKTRYGGNDLYTVANIGFAILTPNTILSGNETGMRRALDRLRRGGEAGAALDNELDPWMHELLDKEQNAELVMVGDVGTQGVVAAAGQQLPFVKGLELVRVLGNFNPPGMNVVGSLTYADAAHAAAGVADLVAVKQLGYLVSLLNAFGFGGQMPILRAEQQENNVAFATEIDTSFLQMILGFLVQATTPANRARQGGGWWG